MDLRHALHYAKGAPAVLRHPPVAIRKFYQREVVRNLQLNRAPGSRGDLKSIGHSWNGLLRTVMYEHPVRLQLQLGAGVSVVGLARMRKATPIELVVLVVVLGNVIHAEARNAAVEEACNLVDQKHNPEIGAIKDVSAGAVMVNALIATGVAVWVLFRRR